MCYNVYLCACDSAAGGKKYGVLFFLLCCYTVEMGNMTMLLYFSSYREDGELEDGEIDDAAYEDVKEHGSKDDKQKNEKGHRKSRKKRKKEKEKKKSKRRRRDKHKVRNCKPRNGSAYFNSSFPGLDKNPGN